ncbi:MFS transporter [Cohnella cholangitidis]|uniref:MFS transporter n=1 Tax=Cohnella cholangitidis TaxID=2598458 RepID=A0A7G5BSP6_9BACL|nr:MFS transporter [Cohnella cholangitidis]QMV39980.1 MFS transporter [Cohnella cholangitidis]
MFANRYVRTIVLSSFLLQLGIWVRNFAILLYITDITNNDELSVSLISVAEFAPIFLFAIIGGTFADRWRPKRTMVASDFLSAASIVAVMLVLAYGSWKALFFATLVSAIMSQFSQPSAMKLFKQHVPQEQLQSVMAMFQSMMAFFMVIGPIIGAFIYAQFGIEVSLGVMGAMFVCSGLVLMSLPKDAEVQRANKGNSFAQDLKDGFGYVFKNRELRTLGGTFIVSGFAVGLIQPLMIFITIENLGQDKSHLQWLLTANGAAMLAGGAVIMSLAKKVQPQLLLMIGLLASTIGTFGIGWSTSIVLTLLFQVINGFCYPMIHIGMNTLIMKNTKAEFIGRVGGVLTPMFMGMMVIGMSLGGAWKEVSSLMFVFGSAAMLFLVGALLISTLLRKKDHVQIGVDGSQISEMDGVRRGQNG